MKVAEGLAESFEATLPESLRALPPREPAAEPTPEETPGEPEIKIWRKRPRTKTITAGPSCPKSIPP